MEIGINHVAFVPLRYGTDEIEAKQSDRVQRHPMNVQDIREYGIPSLHVYIINSTHDRKNVHG